MVIQNLTYYNGCILDPQYTIHSIHDTPSLVACCPDGYSYVEQARTRQHAADMTTNHGSVCLFYKRQLRVRRLCLPVYNAFECEWSPVNA